MLQGHQNIFGRALVARASWTLIDQGFVSIGTFAVNIILARHLSLPEYGSFALIFGFLLMLQVVNTTLVFYPLALRIAEPNSQRDELIWSSFTLMGCFMVPLAALAAVAVIFFGQAELLAPVLIWFVAWQCQETARRVLFSELRHKEAVFGDALSYGGQAAIVAAMAFADAITLPRVILVLAVTSALAAVVQWIQVESQWRHPTDVKARASDSWGIGRWSLASAIMTAMGPNAIFWLMAWLGSRADVAQFQAALNVANIANPILFGLCNIIPQAVARASEHGLPHAWRVAVQYGALGILPITLYYVVVVTSPDLVLRILYGEQSAYVAIERGVQIVATAFLFSYICEIICAYLHGINAARIALNINLLGNTAMAIAAVPLLLTAGWMGGCIAFTGGHSFRLGLALYSLRRGLAPNPNVRVA